MSNEENKKLTQCFWKLHVFGCSTFESRSKNYFVSERFLSGLLFFSSASNLLHKFHNAREEVSDSRMIKNNTEIDRKQTYTINEQFVSRSCHENERKVIFSVPLKSMPLIFRYTAATLKHWVIALWPRWRQLSVVKQY